MVKGKDSTCTVAECDRPARCKGMCNRHYENVRRYGYPVPVREWDLVDVIDRAGWTVTESGCWEWGGSRNEDGYGVLTHLRSGLSNARAHRLMYERFVGPIPDGAEIRHRCDNPPCVNPEHLEPGTHAENMSDMAERGRHWRSGAAECLNGHDLTAPGAYRVRVRGERTERVCLTCQRNRHVRWYKRKHTR